MSYTEDNFVEQPAIQLFANMGWQTLNCFDEPDELGRENRSEVILVNRLRTALKKINPECTDHEIELAIEEVDRDRSAMSLMAANEQCYKLLRDGIKVKADSEEEDTVTVRPIDWNNTENNDFLLCSQLFITGEIETRRPDLIGFVNGLPLVFIELKASHRQLINAYKDNLKDYKAVIPHLFWFNQIILLSNGLQSRVGSISSQWEHFSDWKKIEREKEPRTISLETVLLGTCEKSRLLDLVENFILFVSGKTTVKIIAMYHQYLGVNEALKGLKHIREKQGRLGVFWHTQGSGKSFSMVFFCQKAFRKLEGNWTFVLITDRRDLDEQIYKTFNSAGLLKEECQAESGMELKQLLSEDHRFVFTLIQKFRAEVGKPYPQLSARDDVIVITDEAHRSQYDTLALNMRNALPNAGFMAFTGTPLMAGEEKTRDVFGDYVSIYNFADAVDDGATLPLYYENRVPEVNLNRNDLGDEIARLIDEADLSEESEARLEQEFSRSYHIITRDDRLDTIAKDIVDHFVRREPFTLDANGEPLRGKAMVVAIDKATAIRMYDKVQKEWQLQISALKNQAQLNVNDTALQELIAYMESTDMAVVVSGDQGDYERMAAKGLEFKKHRERAMHEELDKKFKNEHDPLRMVFVCAMWLTGFDAPSVSTLYLDKPLKSHTLMQTIARANRVFPGKTCGQIVDYINIFGALQEALGVYGATTVREDQGDYRVDSPAKDKQELADALAGAMHAIEVFFQSLQINLDLILSAPTTNLQQQKLIQTAMDVLMQPQHKEKFTAYVHQINRIFKGLMPDTRANPYLRKRALINFIYKALYEGMGEQLDEDDVMNVVRSQVDQLLDEAITTIHIQSNLPSPIDISHINFDALAEMLKRTQKPTIADAERLKRIIEFRLIPMIDRNRTRQNLQERFDELVEQYNLGASTAEEFFNQLKKFIEELNEEDRRGVREGLVEEELAIFDMLSSGVVLSEKERNQVKAVAKELLTKLKSALVIDWRKKQQTKARVKQMIEESLDKLPDVYGEPIWAKLCDQVYLHVFDKYAGEGRSIYH